MLDQACSDSGSDSVRVFMEMLREQISSHVPRWRLQSDWQAHVSPFLFFCPSKCLACLFWMALVSILLVPAAHPEIKRASFNHQTVLHPNPIDGIGLDSQRLSDFWDFDPTYNLSLLVDSIWIYICFHTSSWYFCRCSICFHPSSCSNSGSAVIHIGVMVSDTPETPLWLSNSKCWT